MCTILSPGINGSDRKDLLDNPIGWWEKWKELLGNSIYEKKPYSIIAEMLVLNELYKTDKSAKWTGVLGATHDIETDGSSYEVKSTIKRYGATVTISSQYQLDSTKKLQLYFCRLEKSKSGISINDLVNSLVLNGYDSEKLEKQLHKLGYEYGTNVREEKYKILEKRKYNVDDKFPKITNLSFKNDKFPESVDSNYIYN